MQTILLLAQTGLMGAITLWLIFGLRDNILYPDQNKALTNMVLSMELMQTDRPEAFAQVGHRRITDPAWQNRLFSFIVGVEVVVVLVMVASVLTLLSALIGARPAAGAQALAILGATGFTMIWAGFLVAGNHFAYWLCHKEQQFTHFMMTLWGLGTLLFLVLTSARP